jgi:hypothetical protein
MKRSSTVSWLLIAVASYLLFLLAWHMPATTENLYSNGLYLYLRSMLEWLTQWWPVSGQWLVLLLAGAVFWDLIRPFVSSGKDVRNVPTLARIGLSLRRLLTSIAVLVAIFYWSWGYNYARQPIDVQLGITPETLSPAMLTQELTGLIVPLNTTRAVLPAQLPVPARAALQEQGRRLVSATLLDLGYPALRKPRLNMWQPPGLLIRLGASGVYLPWIAQANIDGALHPAQITLISLHELAHAGGLADEAACDFIAYVAAQRSTDLQTQYNGLLGRWRQAGARLKRYDAPAYEALRNQLSAQIQTDLDQINAIYKKYPAIFGDRLYDDYLKWQGIEQGVDRYADALAIWRAWQSKTRE